MKFYKETKIGFFITLIIICLIWGMNFLKGRNLFTTTRQYYAVFGNIGGLQKSSVVSANGYNIGQVSDIRFLPGQIDKLVIEISVDRKFKIPKNSVVEIVSSDIMGSKSINLKMGDSPVIARDKDTLVPKYDGGMTAMIANQVLPIKDKAESLIVSIDSVMKSINNTLTPQTQINIRRSIAAMEELIVSEKLKVDEILNHLNAIAGNLQNSNKAVTNIVNNLSGLSDSLSKADLKRVIDQTNLAMHQTNEILAKVNAGKGSAGKFINSDSVYNSLQGTLKDLDLLIKDLNKNPKRYVHFSVFGSKDSKK